MQYCIGIDPGFTGAVACITNEGKLVYVKDTPTNEVEFVKVGKKRKRHEFDIDGMFKLVYIHGKVITGLEVVSSRPGQGSTSMFRFGHGLGIWEGLITGLNGYSNYEKVQPQRWKKEFNLIGEEKDQALVVARKLFPNAELNLKKHIGRADALLIAEYVRRTFLKGNK